MFWTLFPSIFITQRGAALTPVNMVRGCSYGIISRHWTGRRSGYLLWSALAGHNL